MKIKLHVILGLCLLLFNACSNQTAQGSSGVTLDYLTALASKDKVILTNLSCKLWEEQAVLEADALLSVGAALNNVQCQVAGEEDNFQLVKCSGSLDLTYKDEIRSIDLSLRTYYMALEDGQWRVCSYK